MNQILVIALAGFVLGMRHATDPDHVVAVTTILSRERSVRRAAAVGVVWGIGHTLTIVLVGAAIILLRLTIPSSIATAMELCVALMLIVLGIINVTVKAPAHTAATSTHQHIHVHGDFVHGHSHGHAPGQHGHEESDTPLARLDRTMLSLRLYRYVRPLIVGVVHGLAGTAAVALLVVTVVPQPRWAMAYLLLFGAGTIAGMFLITSAIAVPMVYAQQRAESLGRFIHVAAGYASIAFGLFYGYQLLSAAA